MSWRALLKQSSLHRTPWTSRCCNLSHSRLSGGLCNDNMYPDAVLGNPFSGTHMLPIYNNNEMLRSFPSPTSFQKVSSGNGDALFAFPPMGSGNQFGASTYGDINDKWLHGTSWTNSAFLVREYQGHWPDRPLLCRQARRAQESQKNARHQRAELELQIKDLRPQCRKSAASRTTKGACTWKPNSWSGFSFENRNTC
jgi:hypothetical protein